MMKAALAVAVAALMVLGTVQLQADSFRAKDPGVRNDGKPGAGGPIPGLTTEEREMFVVGLEDFLENEDVADGVGPRFNAPGCGFRHVTPATGGTSPAVNPLFRLVDPNDEFRFTGNVVPSFITPNGPIREARLKFNPDGSRDGGVHNLFVITGNPDASGCNIRQEDFERQIPEQQHHLPDPRRSPAPS